MSLRGLWVLCLTLPLHGGDCCVFWWSQGLCQQQHSYQQGLPSQTTLGRTARKTVSFSTGKDGHFFLVKPTLLREQTLRENPGPPGWGLCRKMATTHLKITSFRENWWTVLLYMNRARSRKVVWKWGQNRSKGLSPDRRKKNKTDHFQ